MIRAAILLASMPIALLAGEPSAVVNLWPEGEMPGPPALVKGDERDLTKTDDRLIAGRRIIKLGHVKTPQAHVFLPPADEANGTAVVVCPGGGFHILAWDLEGTEVAEWLNKQGVAAVVVKYRVPTADQGEELRDANGLAAKAEAIGPLMDVQRALSLTRRRAAEWRIDPKRIGVLGFSAGGHTAALAALAGERRAYKAVDSEDAQPCAANFGILVYAADLATADGSLRKHLEVTPATPPIFLAHAGDDETSCLSSVALFTELHKAGVPTELHVFARGGHGYGLRATDDPVTHWPDLAAKWMKASGLLGRADR